MGASWQTNSAKAAVPTDSPDEQPPPQKPRKRRYAWRMLWLLLVMGLIALGFAASREMRTSKWQAREFSRLAATLTYSVQPGPSDAIVYPGAGPFDQRLGYSALGDFLPRLLKRDYLIQSQARFSDALMNHTRHGLFVPYAEKVQAGLSITDCRGTALYQFSYPQQLYPSFADIPPLVVNSLLFIENRELLNPAQPQANPAVDWPRFAKAAWSQVAKVLHLPGQTAGGSTLATQLEKVPPLPRRADPVRRRKNSSDDFRQCAHLSEWSADAEGTAKPRARLPQQRAVVGSAGAWRSAWHGRGPEGVVRRGLQPDQRPARRQRPTIPGAKRPGPA
jgi:hypothetical protein